MESTEEITETGALNNLRNTKSKRFPSNKIGYQIQNAVTGKYYDFTVGSKESGRLYKVVDACGYNAKDDDPNSWNADHYYYDSPQQYVRRHNGSVSEVSVAKWRERVAQLDAEEEKEGIY